MEHDQSQLSELIEDLSRAKETLAAAELDVRDRQADEADAKAKTERAGRCLKACAANVEAAWSAVRRRIDAQTKNAFEDELANDRCAKLITDKRG